MIATPTPPGVDPSTFKFVVNGRVVYEPFAKQVEYHQCVKRYPLYGGSKGCGKAVYVDEPVPTPNGWTTMGALRVDDQVFDDAGRVCTVTAAFPVMHDQDCYRITFNDGTSLVIDGDHEWHTWTARERVQRTARTDEWRARRRESRPARGTGKKPWLADRNRAQPPATMSAPTGGVRTTKEIAASLIRDGSCPTRNHAIAMCGAWELPEVPLPVDPYVLGVWLGDGACTGGVITQHDEDLAHVAPHLVAAGYPVSRLKGPYVWGTRGLTTKLRALGVLKNKHVPAVYLRASVAQRLALLQGLMDTDGHADKIGRVEFCNTTRSLAEAVYELAISLGQKATAIESVAKLRGRTIGPKWRVCWTPSLPAFRLPRKLARAKTRSFHVSRMRYVASVERTVTVPVRCITVDSPSSLFLVGRAAVPTHNSIAIRFDNYGPCLAVPGLQCLILRRQLEELKRSHLRFVAQEAQLLGAKWKPSDVGAGVLYFPNGSLIEFGHCNHEDNINNYLSAQYGRISFDEIITFSELMYLLIRTSCRTTIPGFIPRVGGGTNPVSKKKAGGYWAKRRWILRDIGPNEDQAYRGGQEYAYIKALPSDNPHLNWEQYEAELSSLPPSLRAAYRDGDWYASEDGFFSEFRRVDKPPLEDGMPRRSHVVEFSRRAPAAPRYCGFDWGYMTDEGVCLWAVYDDDGHLYVEDEFVFNGPTLERYIVKEIAQQVAAKNRARNVDVRKMWCDPAMDAASGHESVETKLQTFQKHIGRVPCVLGERDRENGWHRLRAWLRNHPDGTPFLQIHPRCKHLIRSIGEASVHETKDEDCDTHGFDHPIDALRFLVSGLKAPIGDTSHDHITYPAGSVGALRQRIAAASDGRHVLGSNNVRHAY